jgi:nucleoside 2-deoxyribosyltransferase
MTKPTVFISHSRRDTELAQRFGLALKELGVDVFDPDQELQPGDDFIEAIQSGIKRSDVIIMLVSAPERLQSSWSSYEIGVAEALGKPVRLLLPNRYSVTELPADFASIQAVEFDPQKPERAARAVRGVVAELSPDEP